MYVSYRTSYEIPNGKEYFEECTLCGKVLTIFEGEKDYLKAVSQNLKDKAKKIDQEIKDKKDSE